MTSWGAQYSFGVFLKPLLSDFGWTRGATSAAYSMNMILMGVAGIFAGRLSDRFGPRLVLTICGLIIGLGYLLMSRVTAIWQIYLVYGVLLSIGMSGIFIPLMSSLTKWFTKNRGLANGLAVSGIGIGILVMPLLANLLISRYGWQTSYVIVGSAALALIVGIAQFLRRPPGQSQLPNAKDKAVKTEGSGLLAVGFSFREAIRSRQLWLIFMLFLVFVFGVQAIMVHIVAHATDIGFSSSSAAVILSIVGIVSILVKSSWGLADRWQPVSHDYLLY
jgi:MFS family permease